MCGILLALAIKPRLYKNNILMRKKYYGVPHGGGMLKVLAAPFTLIIMCMFDVGDQKTGSRKRSMQCGPVNIHRAVDDPTTRKWTMKVISNLITQRTTVL